MDEDLNITDSFSPQDRSFLSERINEFNIDTTGIDDARGLTCVLSDERGEIFAGIHGWTWGGFCEIETLWVRADRRGTGLGQRLLAAAEAEARDRGARQIGLTTHSFQAPGFYRARGYRVVGSRHDYPVGHRQLVLVKRLD